MLRRWIKERPAIRRVVLISLPLALVVFLLSNFDPTEAMLYTAVGFAIIGIGASMIDSWITAMDFERVVKKTKEDHIKRETADYGAQKTKPFSPPEKRQIKKKRWSNFGMVFLKILFIILLITVVV